MIWGLVFPAAAEPDGAQLLAMVDYSAVVETMAQACEQSRPELAAAFVAAQKAWWLRNGRVEDKLLTLQSEIGKPRATAFLRYYESLGKALRAEIDGLRERGDTAYASHCDDVLTKLIHGHMDYRRPPRARAIRVVRAQSGMAFWAVSDLETTPLKQFATAWERLP